MLFFLINYIFMRRSTSFLSARLLFFPALLLSLLACEGEVGPPGPQGLQGPPGEPGVSVESAVFEIETDFVAEGNYGVLVPFQDVTDVAVLPSDVVLVYQLVAVIEDSNGDPLDIWRLLPQTVFLEEGTFQYNYEFTQIDVDIFLEGPSDLLAILGNEFTQDLIFRVVIIPGFFADPDARYDFSDYDAVIQQFGIDDSRVKRYPVR